MPLQRHEKEAVVQAMTEQLRSADAVVVTDYRGLTVAQLRKIRRALRAVGAEIHIIKNSLARRAFTAAGLDLPEDLLQGPTALAVLGEDLSGASKVLLAAVEETKLLTIKGGLLGGRSIDLKGVEMLSRLPTRPELLAIFLGTLKAPQRQLVTVLQAPLVQMVGVLKAYSEKEAA